MNTTNTIKRGRGRPKGSKTLAKEAFDVSILEKSFVSEAYAKTFTDLMKTDTKVLDDYYMWKYTAGVLAVMVVIMGWLLMN